MNVSSAALKINAKPQINGNTPEQFIDAAWALIVSLDPVRVALGTIRAEVMNGRNYQHLEGGIGGGCRAADLQIVADLSDLLTRAADLVDAIAAATHDGERGV
jgi:hypothetical protein